MCAQFGHLKSSVAWQFVQNCTPSAFAAPHFGQVIPEFYLESAGEFADEQAHAAHSTTEPSYYGPRVAKSARPVAQVPFTLTKEGSRRFYRD